MITKDLAINNFRRLIEVNETYLQSIKKERLERTNQYLRNQISKLKFETVTNYLSKEKKKTEKQIQKYKDKILQLEKEC